MLGILNLPLIFAGWSTLIRFLVPVWFNPATDSSKINEAKYNGLTINVENLEVNDQYLLFDVQFENGRDNGIAINPEEYYILTSDVPFPSDSDMTKTEQFEGNLTKHYSLSENEVASTFNQDLKVRKNRGTLIGLLGVGLFIFDAAADVNDYHHEWSPGRANAAIARDWLTFGGLTTLNALGNQNAHYAYRTSDDLRFLHREILKKGVMDAHQAGRGKVFFNTSNAKYIRLIIPAGESDFSFDFRQANPDDYKALLGRH